MKKTKNILNISYDKEADVLYVSKGKSSAQDITQETEEEVVVRKDKKTHEIKGFTILHFLKRGINNTQINLPFSFSLK